MPYITQTARQMIKDGGPVQISGELNYALSLAIPKFNNHDDLVRELNLIISRYMITQGRSYRVFNDILGALEGASREYHRRRGFNLFVFDAFQDVESNFYSLVVAPHEDQKIKENGDIY